MAIAAAPYSTARHKESHCTDPDDDGRGWCNGLLVARGGLTAARYDLDAARYGLDVSNRGLTAACGGLDAASLVACCCGLGCGLFCLAVEGAYLDVGLAVAAVFVGIYLVWWRALLHVFTLNSPESSAYIIATAGDYIGWIIAIPIASSLPFLMDGIMVGATRTRVMRDSMILSTIIYFAIFFAFSPLIGNNALWCAFLLYMLLRGVLREQALQLR